MCCMQLLVHFWIAPTLMTKFNSTYSTLSRRDQSTALGYISPLLHHVCVVPVCIWLILQDGMTPIGTPVDYTWTARVMSTSCGYFIADTVVLLPDVLKGKHLDFFAHHAVALAMVAGPGLASPTAWRWTPHFMMSESTSVLFGMLWWLRKTGRESSSLYLLNAVSFTVLYFFKRVIGIPAATLALFVLHSEERALAGPSVWLLPVASLLQWYWFKLIVQGLCDRVRSGATNTGGKGNLSSKFD